MLFGKRNPRSSAPRRRGACQPAGLALEERCLLAGNAINLASIATTPYGVQFNGPIQGAQAGFNVAYVGNVNANSAGFDDFLVSAPNAPGNPSKVYLVFGSQSRTGGNVDWKQIASSQRIGSLAEFNIQGQTSGYDYAGVQFTSNSDNTTNAQVAAVGDVNGDGIPDFMISFPNASSTATAQPLGNQTGVAYLCYGGPEWTSVSVAGGVVNLDAPQTGLSIIKFQYVNPGATQISFAHAGTSMASVGNFFGDGRTAIAIGAPDASYNLGQSGAVYVIPGSLIGTKQSGLISLDLIGQTAAGQTGGLAGAVFTGAALGDRAGYSLAGAGGFSTATTATNRLNDLLIGAPAYNQTSGSVNGPGNAYLIYGSRTITNLSTVIQGVNQISLTRVGTPATGAATNVAGIDFVGNGDGTGFSVSSAGDFNGDGVNDVLIGSPAAGGGAGLVTLVYGELATSTAGALTGAIPLNAIPSSVPAAQFPGPGAGALAGWSVSPTGFINNDAFNEVLFGAPGFQGGAGIVYLVPGQANLVGTFPLSAAQADPVDATLITDSVAGPGGVPEPIALGQSVSGIVNTTAKATLDSDGIADFLIGSPAFSPSLPTTGPVANAGAAFALEGAFIPLAIPTNTNTITTQIGVDTPFPPFTVNAAQPSTMQIFVFSNATTTPPFQPLTDIDPTTIVVNGIRFPNATIAPVPASQGGPDLNGDGIPDAIITISPRSSLGLLNGPQTLTITGRTLAGSPNAGKVFQGSAAITVTGGGGGSGGIPASIPNSFFSLNFPGLNTFPPPLGERLVPTVSTLSHLTWRPLPYPVAYAQFRPTRDWAFRTFNALHPNSNYIAFNPAKSSRENRGYKSSTLGRNVFNRGAIQKGQPYRYVHPVPVIPSYLQVEGSVSHQFRTLSSRP